MFVWTFEGVMQAIGLAFALVFFGGLFLSIWVSDWLAKRRRRKCKSSQIGT